MSSLLKQKRYQSVYLICPAIAYGCYLLLSGLAVTRQHTGSMNINFAFLTFWGIWVFLIGVGLSLLGFIYKKRQSQILLIINIAVSTALVIVVVVVASLLYKTKTANYACDDSIRCLFTQS